MFNYLADNVCRFIVGERVFIFFHKLRGVHFKELVKLLAEVLLIVKAYFQGDLFDLHIGFYHQLPGFSQADIPDKFGY